MDQDDSDEDVDYNKSGMPPPWFPFFLELAELQDAGWHGFLIPWSFLILVSKWSFLPRAHH